MAVSRPKSCPDCGYDLRAHPPPNRCPECGFSFDEHTLIWRPRPTALIYDLIALGIPFMVLATFLWLTPPQWRAAVYQALTIGFLVPLVYPFWLMYRRHKRRRFVALTARGVELRSTAERASIAWSAVSYIVLRPGWLTKGVVNIVVKRRVFPYELAELFENFREMRLFRAEFDRAWHRYLDANPKRPDGAEAQGVEPVDGETATRQ